MVQYLIRLDDLCPTNNLQKWERFFQLFDQYHIKPIIAVIPDNKDPKLLACGNFNTGYWQLVRGLRHKGYIIGMHGFEHLYQTNNSGMFKMNKRSEFAGLPYHLQEQKIRAAIEIFNREGITPDVFIAPAHTFDYNTLLAIKNCTNIKVISDGVLTTPYLKYGFKWVPVQLSEAVLRTNSTWTFNFHPETCSDEVFHQLQTFIKKYHTYFVSFSTLQYKTYNWVNSLQEQYLINKHLLKDLVKRLIAM